VNFGKYIHELLLENEIVVVTGFGAFVSEYKPAEISENSEEIKPPSKIVTFNQQIRNNDGLLVGHVAEIKQISHFDALKAIEAERENILYRLDNGEEVELKGVGILVYTSENKIDFKPIQDDNLLLDSFGLETTSIVPEVEESEELPEEMAIIEEEETTVTPIVEEDILEGKAVSKEEEKEEEPVLVSNFTINSAEKETEEEAKKKKAWLWYLLILVPLVAVSVFVFIKGEKGGGTDKQKEQNTISIIEEPAIILQDTTVSDSIEIALKDTIQTEMPNQDTAIIADPNTPKYYLVGGSFSVEENAETYRQELIAKGYDAFHAGKKGRFFIVGIGTYNSFNKADEAKIEYMENNPDSEVWVWKK
jgi:nucleoid DNA-binding protein/cell division protein FtsN